MTWSVYMVRCADGSIYTGASNDVRQRVESHSQGRGAKYTRPSSKRPVALIWQRECASRGAALRLEASIKKLKKFEKEQMVNEICS